MFLSIAHVNVTNVVISFPSVSVAFASRSTTLPAMPVIDDGIISTLPRIISFGFTVTCDWFDALLLFQVAKIFTVPVPAVVVVSVVLAPLVDDNVPIEPVTLHASTDDDVTSVPLSSNAFAENACVPPIIKLADIGVMLTYERTGTTGRLFTVISEWFDAVLPLYVATTSTVPFPAVVAVNVVDDPDVGFIVPIPLVIFHANVAAVISAPFVS